LLAARSIYYVWFFPRQIVRPHLIAGLRKIYRVLTADRDRDRAKERFFGDWVKPR
jgi:hypothetical protein